MDFDIPGLGTAAARSPATPLTPGVSGVPADADTQPPMSASASVPDAAPVVDDGDAGDASVADVGGDAPKGVKRKLEPDEDEDAPADEDEEAVAAPLARIVRADGTVDQPDTIKYGLCAT